MAKQANDVFNEMFGNSEQGLIRKYQNLTNKILKAQVRIYCCFSF